MLLEHFLAGPIEPHHERLIDGAKRIGALVQAASDEVLAVGAQRETAHTTVVHALSAVICMQILRLELADLFAGRNFPLPNVPHQVAGEQVLAVGMKHHAVNIQFMPGHLTDELAVSKART